MSQLKKEVGPNDQVASSLPPLDDEGQHLLIPVAILGKMIVKWNNAAVGQRLIQWSHLPIDEATWEDAEEFMCKFKDYNHAGRVL